eukprot:PhF_6_TR39870/c0_g1_i2/m.59280
MGCKSSRESPQRVIDIRDGMPSSMPQPAPPSSQINPNQVMTTPQQQQQGGTTTSPYWDPGSLQPHSAMKHTPPPAPPPSMTQNAAPQESVVRPPQGNPQELVLACMDCYMEIMAPGTPDVCPVTGRRHH